VTAFLDYRILETPRTFTPLGLRFWDTATGSAVAGGLSVTAWRPDAPYPPVHAVRTLSGAYALSELPGLRALERPRVAGSGGPGGADEAPPAALDFVLTVEDRAGRFLPEVFSVTLPLPYRGLFLSAGAGSVPRAARAYLFSAPTRPVPPALAAVRADLLDASSGQPAAYAAVEVAVAGAVHSGIADERGRVLVAFPYPPVERLRLGSPPGAGQGDVTGQTWPATVRVRWSPAPLARHPADLAGVPAALRRLPGLKAILTEQAPAYLIGAEGAAPLSEWTVELGFGRELLLATALPGGAEGRHPELWILSGSSTP